MTWGISAYYPSFNTFLPPTLQYNNKGHSGYKAFSGGKALEFIIAVKRFLCLVKLINRLRLEKRNGT